MIKIEHVDIYGFESAIRGMRNPLNSWSKSDSYWTHIEDAQTLETAKYQFHIGENDLNLMKQLSKAGNDHGKFLRMMCRRRNERYRCDLRYAFRIRTSA